MAKVAFSKLKCKINDTEVPVQIGEETVMVKQYLPIQDKLRLIGRVVELAHEEDYNFSNPVKINVFKELEIVFAYTNITFTDKQKEDLPKLYDALKSTNLIDNILQKLPEEELMIINKGVMDSIEAFYQYQNSAVGLLENIRNQYSNAEINVDNLQKTLMDLSNSPIIKDVLPLVGLE